VKWIRDPTHHVTCVCRADDPITDFTHCKLCKKELCNLDKGWDRCFDCYKIPLEKEFINSYEQAGYVVTKHGIFSKKMEIDAS
tara:strand:- start:1411 stop:1659 length:249 start_codon:yes stop_codon:yes gene_type:complete